MKLTLAEPKYLKESISIISELVNEARFKITKDGIELVAMDPANVAMVLFKILPSSFIEYDISKDVEIGVNLGHLKQVLRRIKSNDMLSLEVSSENKLDINLKGKTQRKFSLPLIELEEREQKIPDLSFPITISTTADILSDAVEDVDIVAESVLFEAEKDKVGIKAEGDLSKASVVVRADDSTKIKGDFSEPVKSKYSIEYLKKMISGSKLASDVVLQFKKDYPMRLEYKSVDKVMLSFILAPRVEND